MFNTTITHIMVSLSTAVRHGLRHVSVQRHPVAGAVGLFFSLLSLFYFFKGIQEEITKKMDTCKLLLFISAERQKQINNKNNNKLYFTAGLLEYGDNKQTTHNFGFNVFLKTVDVSSTHCELNVGVASRP